MTTVRDIAWLAGLLEGEGCFDCPARSPRIQLGMTDEDTIRRAQRLMGGTIRRAPGQKEGWLPQYKTSVYGHPAAAWMMTLYPLMSARRQEKIAECLGRWKLARRNSEKTHCPQGHPYSGENLRIGSNGGRTCRICGAASFRRAYLRRKAA